MFFFRTLVPEDRVSNIISIKMIYLKQIKLINPDEVSGPVEDLKYPYKAAAVRYMDELVFTKPVTFLVGENGIGKSTLLEAVMYKYERRDEDLQGMLMETRVTKYSPMSCPARFA